MTDYLEKYLFCPYCQTENLVDLSDDFDCHKCRFCEEYFALVEDSKGIVSAIGLEDSAND